MDLHFSFLTFTSTLIFNIIRWKFLVLSLSSWQIPQDCQAILHLLSEQTNVLK